MVTLLTLDELAVMLQKTPAAVRRMRERGQLPPAVVLGRSLRWDEADVLRWLEDRKEVPRGVVPIRRGRPRKAPTTSTSWRIS